MVNLLIKLKLLKLTIVGTIAGGIAAKILPILATSDFRDRFESKGRLRSYLADIPVYVVTASDTGLRGAAQFLSTRSQRHLRRTSYAGK